MFLRGGYFEGKGLAFPVDRVKYFTKGLLRRTIWKFETVALILSRPQPATRITRLKGIKDKDNPIE